MIDKIQLINKDLNPDEIMQIVSTNNLQTNFRDGDKFYNNLKKKNIQDGGVFIQIQVNNRLKVECSLHKYYNHLTTGKSLNYNNFSMKQAKETALELIRSKGISENNLFVYRYEIGLNLEVKQDCRKYLDIIKSIGTYGREKELLVNQKFKDKREKTTEFHKDRRVYFKVYDKVYEMKDRRKGGLPDGNILRIETVYRRLEKMTFEKFFSPGNIEKMVFQFFNDWRTVQFKREITAPKGTTLQKKQLCKDILNNGAATVLQKARENRQSGNVSEKGYRGIREFIERDWPEFKDLIGSVQSEEETEYRSLLELSGKISKC